MMRMLTAAVLGLVLSAATVSPAAADEFGDPGFQTTDTGMPGSFGAIMLLGLLVAVGTTLWRVSLARRVARDSGMDPNRATEITLLEDDGLEAAYLAGNLRPRPGEPTTGSAGGAPAGTAEARLRELVSLRDAGLLTPEEYDARRKAIVESL